MNLPEAFKKRIKSEEPLKPRTSFGIGGKARFWYEPKDRRELASFLKSRGVTLPLFVIGAGSNLLIREGLIDKIFINLTAPDFNKIEVDAEGVTAGAGVRLGRLVSALSRHDLGGHEFLAGIPGTLGGALVMNAGARENVSARAPYREIGDIVSWVDIFDRQGRLRRLRRGDIRFAYRSCDLKPHIVLAARLQLIPKKRVEVQKKIRGLIHRRIRTQDWRHPSAGSFFKNPPAAEPAGRLIDLCELKGFKVGGAQVSPRHANFIINVGSAVSGDVLALAEVVRRRVFERFGVELAPEVEIVS